MNERVSVPTSADKVTDVVSLENNWFAVFAIALTATIFCTTEFLPIGILRYISLDMGVSEGTAGIMVTAPGLLAALAAPSVALLARDYDRKLVLGILTLAMVISNTVAMVTPNFAILIVARALFGLGLGGFWTIGAGLGERLVSEKQVGRATSIIFAGVSLGMLIGGPAGVLLGDLFGWRAAFGAALAISVVGILAQLLALPSIKPVRKLLARDIFVMLGSRDGFFAMAAMFAALCGQFATYTYITPFLAEISGFDGKSISAVLFGYTLIGLIGNFIGGAVSAKSARLTFAFTSAFIGLPLVFLPLTNDLGSLQVLLLFVWGTAYGAMPVALQMTMARVSENGGDGAMALFVANFQISIAVGSGVGGVLVDHVGLSGTLYCGAAAMLGSIFLVNCLRRKSHEGEATEGTIANGALDSGERY